MSYRIDDWIEDDGQGLFERDDHDPFDDPEEDT